MRPWFPISNTCRPSACNCMGPCDSDDRYERALSETETGLRLAIRLQPGASANRIEGLETLADGRTVLRARVTAPPEKGKANQALIKLLAKTLKLPKGDVTIVAGATDRRKTVAIAGDPAELKAKLRTHLGA